MALYGGKFNSLAQAQVDWSEIGIDKRYIYENFNDFGQGLLTCFHLLVVNNFMLTVSLIKREII